MFTKNKPFENEPQSRPPVGPVSADLRIPPAPEPTPRPEATRPASRSSTLSTLSAGVKYEGNISGSGELQVDGSLKGDIRVVQVTIGESGAVEGSIHADVLHIKGRVSGTIVAKQVHLFATSRVEGDITQEQISIDRGAWFQGRCTQAKRDAGPPLPTEPIEKPAPAKPEKIEAKSE